MGVIIYVCGDRCLGGRSGRRFSHSLWARILLFQNGQYVRFTVFILFCPPSFKMCSSVKPKEIMYSNCKCAEMRK